MSLSWSEATRLAAKGGPADRLRRWLIAGCAALAGMLATAVVSVPSFWNADDSVDMTTILGSVLGDRDLGVGAMLGLSLLAAVVIHLMSQTIRVGAPSRDRRLLAMRAAGADRTDVRAVLRAEAVACAAPGVVVGIGAFYALMSVVPKVTVEYVQDYTAPEGAAIVRSPVLRMEAWPHPILVLCAGLLVLVLMAVLVPMAGRRLVAGHDARPARSRLMRWVAVAPTVLAGIIVVGAVTAPVAGQWGGLLVGQIPSWMVALAPIVLIAAFIGALAWASPPLVGWIGRRLSRRGSATAVLAGGMMQARPHLAARSTVSLVLVGIVGGLAVVLGGGMEAALLHNATINGFDARQFDGVSPFDVIWFSVPADAIQVLAVVAAGLGAVGLLIGVSEQVALRGSDLARQIALGIPRSAVRRALVVEMSSPVIVMVTGAMAAGVLVGVGVLALSDADIAGGIHWGRLAGLWVIIVGGAVLTSWLGGFALPSAAAPQHIRDRE